MNVSLEEAIEIFARALRHRKGATAGAEAAVDEAERCKAILDLEGVSVWLRVRDALEAMQEDAVLDDE